MAPRAAKAKPPEQTAVELHHLAIQQIVVEVVGMPPGMICHKFSEKMQKEMGAKQEGKAKTGKAPRKPEEEAHDSLHLLDDKTAKEVGTPYGFPATAFKQAMVAAGGRFADYRMTELRGSFFIIGGPDNLVPLFSSGWQPRTDYCRLSSGVASLTHRAHFPDWKARLEIEYNAMAITPEQIVNLLELAGFSNGIGDWRPEKDGDFGRFRVAKREE